MKFNFEHFNDINADIEQLEEGVYIERLGGHAFFADIADDLDFIYGDILHGKEGWIFEPAFERNLIALDVMLMKQLARKEVSEEEVYVSVEPIICLAENGCSVEDFKQILLSQGFVTEQYYGLSMREMMELLVSEGKLLCTVNSGVIGEYSSSRLRGIAADCMVEVIGMDLSNPVDIRVYYNSPTIKDGCGKSCTWDLFQDAWKLGGRYALFVSKGQ